MRRIGIALSVLLLVNAASVAHYNMLFPDKPWAEKGEKVTFTYQFGHPFEHELSDAPKPVGLRAFNPRGIAEDLEVDKTMKLVKVDGADGKKVDAWQFTFVPQERGDFTFVLKTPPFKHDENTQVEDVVRVVLHVQTQNGWDGIYRPFDNGIDLWPYTRPYGLLPGMAFKGRVVKLPFVDEFDKQSLQFVNGLQIEVEKYNAKAPKKLPPDELITFKTKADANGFFMATLLEAGWWGVTAVTPRSKNRIGQRATHWVHVDEKK